MHIAYIHICIYRYVKILRKFEKKKVKIMPLIKTAIISRWYGSTTEYATLCYIKLNSGVLKVKQVFFEKHFYNRKIGEQ